MRLLEAAAAQKWAMTEPWLRQVLEIANRENESVEAVEARLGRKLDNTQTVTMRDGVAILPVTGPIFPRANLLTEVSGATSVQMLAREFTAALENPMVRAIVLDVDSPGGSISGIHEFAEMVYAARGRKPMATYVGSTMASAAYHIGSATDEIVMDRMAAVGSLGVVAVIPDPSKKQAKDLEIVSSQSPKKRIDPSTEMGRAHIQEEVDKLAEIMLEKIATYRGMISEDVMRAQGAMVLADDAIQMGLADRLGSMESLLAEMSDPTKRQAPMRRKEKHMAEQGFWSRIGAALGLTEAKEENVEQIAAAAEAQRQENEQLRVQLAALREQHEAEARAAEEASKEEIENRITAEVNAETLKHEAKFGKASREAFSTLLRGVKVAGATDVEAGLLAFVESLPAIGSTERVAPADVDIEAVAAEAKGETDPNAALNASIEATLRERKLKPGTEAWGKAFTAEYRRLTSEAK